MFAHPEHIDTSCRLGSPTTVGGYWVPGAQPFSVESRAEAPAQEKICGLKAT